MLPKSNYANRILENILYEMSPSCIVPRLFPTKDPPALQQLHPTVHRPIPQL
jgi:hypothetical protein